MSEVKVGKLVIRKGSEGDDPLVGLVVGQGDHDQVLVTWGDGRFDPDCEWYGQVEARGELMVAHQKRGPISIIATNENAPGQVGRRVNLAQIIENVRLIKEYDPKALGKTTELAAFAAGVAAVLEYIGGEVLDDHADELWRVVLNPTHYDMTWHMG